MNVFKLILLCFVPGLQCMSCADEIILDKNNEVSINYEQLSGSNNVNDSIKAIGKLISFQGGDKIHFASFIIVKSISGKIRNNDTITVGYYNYHEPDIDIKYALLSLDKYLGESSIKNYYICPNYDGRLGIQSAQVEFIDRKHWLNCELGKGDCDTLDFFRKQNELLYLIMPCAGTETQINVNGPRFVKEIHINQSSCPPLLTLTELDNGVYSASMLSCGLGGDVCFRLSTR